MSDRMNLTWRAPGPVSAGFMADRSKVAVLNGPVGSAKTTTCSMKLVRLAAAQAPSKTRTIRNSQGVEVPVRRTRYGIIRETYRELWRTTIPSWNQRFPQSVGVWNGAKDAPATHKILFELPDGTVVDFEAEFRAPGENGIEEFFQGWEVTGFYLNEMDKQTAEVFQQAIFRAGRFPPMEEGGPSWYGLIGDCNAPDLNNWLYQDMFEKSPDELAARDIKLFRQPGGRDPGAENLQNLVPGYYTSQAKTLANQPWLVRRMVDNIPGYSRDGKPVYETEFNDALHVPAEPLEFVEGITLQIGLDGGLNPAAIFAQHMPNGQWRVLREMIGEPGTGAMRFGQDLARFLKTHFPTARKIIGWADPSSAYGADKKAGELDWIQIVANQAGLIIRPAPTNALTPRLEAVRLPLTRLIDGKPGLVLSVRCPKLRAGFNATYRWRKVRGNEQTYHEEPEKNEASHPHDGLQYVLSGGGEHTAVHARVQAHNQQTMRQQHVHDWDPLNPGAVA